MKITSLVCPGCGASLAPEDGKSFAVCEYCSTTVAFEGESLQAKKINNESTPTEHSGESDNSTQAEYNGGSARAARAGHSGRAGGGSLVKKICGVGIFSALAFITTLLCKLIPNVAGFLSIDAKDAVIAISSFVYGPLVAPIISIIVAFIEFITISETGIWGLLMNFASSTAFSLTASLIYKKYKSFNGAIVGFIFATVVTTAVMVGLNPLIVPLYTGAPREVVIEMLPTVLLPFNFAKTLMNSAISILLYKPIIGAMRSARLIPKKEHKTTFNKTSVLTIAVGAAFLVAALVILIIIW